MEALNTPLLGLILYLVVVLAVGLLTWGMNRTKEDFLIGGRRLGAWVIALSERTAAESAWLILGLSGAVFWIGMGELWTVIGCVAGIILSWILIAKPLRIESEKLGAITLPEYFAQKSGPYSQWVRVISTLIIVFFFAFYVGAQVVGSSKVMSVTFGITPFLGMIIGASVIIIYTMMGGFMAVCYTDVVQAVLMIITLVALPVVGIVFIASRGIDITAAMEATRNTTDLFNAKNSWAAAALAIGGLSWGLGYMGQPHLVTKFMAIRRADEIRRGRTVAIIWTILAYCGAVLCGIVGIVLIKNSMISETLLLDAAGKTDIERILPVLATFLFPAWFAGILISGAVAAMMSTADSQLLVATSAVVEDFYSRTLKRNMMPKKMVFFSRMITIGVGVFGFVLALTTTDLIYKMVSYAWSGLGSAFGPALVLSLYWKRIHAAGIIAGMLTGAISTVIWTEIAVLNSFISVRAVSFVLAFIAVIIGTLLVKRTESQRFHREITSPQ